MMNPLEVYEARRYAVTAGKKVLAGTLAAVIGTFQWSCSGSDEHGAIKFMERMNDREDLGMEESIEMRREMYANRSSWWRFVSSTYDLLRPD